MIYGGEYRNPDDLPEIYGRVHLTWAFDFLDEGSNSDWLLPNRLYEGGYFGSVALASSHTETGKKVRELGLGYTFEPPEIGRAHVCTPVTNAHFVCRLPLDQ